MASRRRRVAGGSLSRRAAPSAASASPPHRAPRSTRTSSRFAPLPLNPSSLCAPDVEPPLYAYIESVRSLTLEPAFLPRVCVPLRCKPEKGETKPTIRPKPSEPCVPSPPPRSTPASSRCVLKLVIFTQPHTTSHTRTLPFCHSSPPSSLSLTHPETWCSWGLGMRA